MRTMKISDLSNYTRTKTEFVEGTEYTVHSLATFQTDSTGTASCDAGTAKADYIEIRATVTWPSRGERPPVVAQSLVAPPNGSISAESGSLAVKVEDATSEGLEGIGLAGSGPDSFSGVTGENGCAVFGNLSEGSYTLNVTTGGLVDRNGNPPVPKVTSVVAEGTNTIALQYDRPGEIAVDFRTRIGGELVAASTETVVAFNSGMDLAKAFGEPGAAQELVGATPLFPFESAYTVYAGSCTANNPVNWGLPEPPPAMADALVSAGGTTPVTLELPALNLRVLDGEGEGSPGAPVAGAEVVISEGECDPENPVVRTYETGEAGELPNPGLPFGKYLVCVASEERKVTVPDLLVPTDADDMQEGTDLAIYLGHPAAETGTCQ
jgi:hypothetical protein